MNKGDDIRLVRNGAIGHVTENHSDNESGLVKVNIYDYEYEFPSHEIEVVKLVEDESVEQNIWDEFKDFSEAQLWDDMMPYVKAKRHYGVGYDDSLQTISRIDKHQILKNDVDYKIEKALSGETINWDEVKKLYPKSEINFKYNYKPKYPEPKWRTKEEWRSIENLLFKNYGSPEGLNELFKSENEAYSYLKDKRWGDNIICPKCNARSVFSPVAKRRSYACSTCSYQVYPTAGTIFEKTPFLSKWFHGIYLLSSTKTQKISSPQLGRAIGCTYKTARIMRQKIKSAVNDPMFEEIRNGLFNKKLIA